MSCFEKDVNMVLRNQISYVRLYCDLQLAIMTVFGMFRVLLGLCMLL